MSRLRHQTELFLLAVQFLTRLPVSQNLPYSEDRVEASVGWYPAVGLLVGTLGALVWLAGAVLPPAVAALLAVGAVVLATGALHEDGLADAADGLGGAADKARALEIMRDSRIGSYGVVALVLVLGARISGLASFPLWDGALALIAAHTFSRFAAVHIIATAPYARAEGSKFPAPSVTSQGYRLALGLTLAVVAGYAMCTTFFGAVLACLLGMALGALFRRIFLRKLGGYTGDCLGGIQQLTEVGFLLGALAWL